MKKVKQKNARSTDDVTQGQAAAGSSVAPEHGDTLCGTDYVGNVIPLRKAVDIAVRDIDGIVEECRRALDRACAMHVYAAGNCGGDCSSKWDAEDNVSAEFNDAMAEAAGALKCLLSYVDCIRADAAAKARAKAAAAAMGKS